MGHTTQLGTFRSEYEYEVQYKYDFSNLVRMLLIMISHTNLVPRSPFSASQQQGESTVLANVIGLKFESRTRIQI